MGKITVKDVIAYENKNFVARYTTDDYVKLYLPMHPLCDTRGRVKEHRWIMEKHLGRFLEEGEVVHHINENPQDNRIENLQLMTIADHISYHRNKNKEERDNRVCYNDPTHKTIFCNSMKCWRWFFLDGDKNKPICSYCHNRDYKQKHKDIILAGRKRYFQKNKEKILERNREYKRRKRLKDKGVL